MKVNTRLLTKDGRKFSNAIVTKVEGDNVWFKTDYGNTVGPSSTETIRAFFYIEDSMDMVESHKHCVKKLYVYEGVAVYALNENDAVFQLIRNDVDISNIEAPREIIDIHEGELFHL